MAASPKARQAKSKARLQRFEELQSKEFQERNETNEIYIPPGERLGDLVIEVNNLKKSYGERLLFDNLSFKLPAGGIVGIIGPNGAGKTTLFRMLTGQEAPDDGLVVTDPGITIGYFSQDVGEMSGHSAVTEVMNGAGPVLSLIHISEPTRPY